MRPDQNEPAPALRALRKSVIRSARSPRVWFAFAVLLIALDYFRTFPEPFAFLSCSRRGCRVATAFALGLRAGGRITALPSLV